MTPSGAPCILISRPDAIGDVVLTLPLAGFIKECMPQVTVAFLGRSYTRPIIEACRYVDVFLDYDEVKADPGAIERPRPDTILHVLPDKWVARRAAAARIKKRIGTAHRLHHWLYCNQLVWFSRRNSDLHEAQLNFKLLQPLGLPDSIPLASIPLLYGLSPQVAFPAGFSAAMHDGRFQLILHPKSAGSAREWPAAHWLELARMLPPEAFQLWVTGTEAEGQAMARECPALFALPNVQNVTGRMSLAQLIAFLNQADGVVAASTGPLHIASALGRNVLGLFPPIRPMHPGRWAPVGLKAQYLMLGKSCSDCRTGGACVCMAALSAAEIQAVILEWAAQKV